MACFRAGRGYGDGGREAELHALPFGTKNSGQERRGQPCAVPVARRDDEVHFHVGVDAQRGKVVCARSHVVERQPVAFLVEPQDVFPVFVHAVEVGIEAEPLLDERESVVPDGIRVEGQVIPGVERAEPQVAFTVFQDGGKHAVVVERRGEGGGDKAAIGSAVEDVEGIVGKHPKVAVTVVLRDVEIDVAFHVLLFVGGFTLTSGIETEQAVAPRAQPIPSLPVFVHDKRIVHLPHGRTTGEAVVCRIPKEQPGAPCHGPHTVLAVFIDGSDARRQVVSVADVKLSAATVKAAPDGNPHLLFLVHMQVSDFYSRERPFANGRQPPCRFVEDVQPVSGAYEHIVPGVGHRTDVVVAQPARVGIVGFEHGGFLSIVAGHAECRAHPNHSFAVLVERGDFLGRQSRSEGEWFCSVSLCRGPQVKGERHGK